MADEVKLAAPPYVSWKTFVSFLDWLGEVSVPSRLDRSFWGHKLSGAYGAQVLAALRFFGLLDEENRPDKDLEVIAGHEDQRKAFLRQALTARYANILDGLNLERATAGELIERFRRYPISGETFNKALNFFIQAAQYADIPLSQHITKRTRRAASGGPSTSKQRKRGRPRKEAPAAPSSERQQQGANVEYLGMHPSLEALLRDLNLKGASWTQAERDRWVATFTTILDYVYPTGAEAKDK